MADHPAIAAPGIVGEALARELDNGGQGKAKKQSNQAKQSQVKKSQAKQSGQARASAGKQANQARKREYPRQLERRSVPAQHPAPQGRAEWMVPGRRESAQHDRELRVGSKSLRHS